MAKRGGIYTMNTAGANPTAPAAGPAPVMTVAQPA